MPFNGPLYNPQFPTWVFKKIGANLLNEADWNYASLPNGKYGAFVDGTGTISKDTTNFFWGGAGSCKMLTDAVANHSAEVKTSIMGMNIKQGDLLAFECKFAPTAANNNTTQFQMGIEARSHTTILHSRFRWSKALAKWQIETTGGAYIDFSAISSALTPGIATTETPNVDANVGNIPQWCRSVIDPIGQTYTSFESIILQNGFSNYVTYDLRPYNFPLVSEGTATVSLYLFFCMCMNGTGAAADSIYTTDWCISRIPKGVAPF